MEGPNSLSGGFATYGSEGNVGEGSGTSLPEGPKGDLNFSVYSEEKEIAFTPLYFPERLNVTTGKELNKTSDGCEGENVRIKKLKNSTIHATGLCLARDLGDLNAIAHEPTPLEVISPTIDSGGMQVYVEKAERGNMQGWDAFQRAQDWLFEYTIDMVSTGEDEYEAATTGGRFEFE